MFEKYRFIRYQKPGMNTYKQSYETVQTIFHPSPKVQYFKITRPVTSSRPSLPVVDTRRGGDHFVGIRIANWVFRAS